MSFPACTQKSCPQFLNAFMPRGVHASNRERPPRTAHALTRWSAGTVWPGTRLDFAEGPALVLLGETAATARPEVFGITSGEKPIKVRLLFEPKLAVYVGVFPTLCSVRLNLAIVKFLTYFS